jgi:hypothetical protein
VATAERPIPPTTQAVLLNILHIVIIERCEVRPRFALGPKQFIELGVKSLSIAVFGSIDEQCHQPRC